LIARLNTAAGEVLTAKQAPHRPGTAPALGLRAGDGGPLVASQTCSYLENFTMWLNSEQRRLLKRKFPSAPARRKSFRPLLEALEDRLTPATITVTSPLDSVVVDGMVTLHEAVDSINAGSSVNSDVVSTGAYDASDRIQFNIPGAGVHTISMFGFPWIMRPVVIDGYSQPGAHPNTLANGDNAVLLIELNAGSGSLVISAGSSAVRGLVINRASSNGIELNTNGGNTIEGNFIGTDATGTAANANGGFGVAITNSPNNTIGGMSPEARNLISGNNNGGVLLQFGATGNLVAGNFIGTEVTGTAALRNLGDGVAIKFSSGNTIGGTVAEARNLISGNNARGINLEGASSNLVQGNYIGTDVTGALGLGNGNVGVLLQQNADTNTIGGTTLGARNVISGNSQGVYIVGAGNLVQGNFIGTDAAGAAAVPNGTNGVAVLGSNTTIGGTEAGAGNTIAFNRAIGVAVVFPSTGNAIHGNSIFANGGVGIRLDVPQKVPLLTSASSAGASTTIEGTFHSTPSSNFLLEFFASAVADPSGSGEGQTYLGSAPVNTNTDGYATFTVMLPVALPAGQTVISATATDPAGNTSEFSGDMFAAVQDPPSVHTELISQTVCAGDSVTFTATASGTPRPTVQWQVSGDGGMTFTDIAGATSTTLAFTATVAENGNRYRAVFTNTAGSATTNAAPLTVNTIPVVTINPANQTVNVGAEVPDTIGIFDPSTATFYLRNELSPGAADAAAPFRFGAPGWVPLAGDWTGTGHTGIGVFDPSTATFYLRNELSPGAADAAAPFQFGAPGWVPLAGDWTGSGRTGIGVFDPSTATFYLRNELSPGAADAAVAFRFGASGWVPLTGDWTGSGRTGIGAVDPTTATFYLRNELSPGAPEAATPFLFGAPGWLPVAGDWVGANSARAGSTATFTAAATGDPAPTVQWQVSSDGGTTFTDIAGATSTTMAFTANSSQDTDEYRAVFSNCCGTAISTAAELTVTSSISGESFNDLNGNGRLDEGETPLSGWTVFLDQNHNGLPDTAVLTTPSSDAPRAIAGRNTVSSVLRLDGVAGTVTDVNVTVDLSGTSAPTVYLVGPRDTRVLLFSGVGGAQGDFSDTTLDDQAEATFTDGSAPFAGRFRPQGSLLAFNGLDPNGAWRLEVRGGNEADSATLNNWSLTVTYQEPVAQTGLDGRFAFDNVPPGIYQLDEVLQSGWMQTSALSRDVRVTGQEVIGVNFGNYQPSSISGTVFNDLNNDGIREAGEPGLAGRTVFLDSDNNGNLAGIDLNSYSTDTPMAIDTSKGLTLSNLHVSAAGTVTSFVGVLFTSISYDQGSLLDLSLTSPSGTRVNLLAGLIVGFQRISNIFIDDFAPQFFGIVPRSSGDGLINVILPPFDDTSETNFDFLHSKKLSTFNGEEVSGNWQLAVKSYGVLEYVDETGQLHPNGPGTGVLGSWALEFGFQETAVQTDAAGNYSFSGLKPGTYVVREVTPGGWIETAPAAGGPYTVTPDGGADVPGRDFGNRLLDPGVLQFGSATYRVSESGGSATVTVTRNDGSDGLAQVDYTTTGGTATAGTDYTATSGTLTFAQGVTSANFTIPIRDDALVLEDNETVELTLSNPRGAALGSVRTAVLNIVEDGPGAATTTFPQPSSVSGTVFNDLDGIPQAVAPGLAGRTVFLDENNDGRLDEAEDISGTSTPQAIPSSSDTQFNTFIDGVAGTLTRMRLELSILNPDADPFLAVELTSPAGTRFTFAPGQYSPFFKATFFNQPVSGISGQDLNGIWQLTVREGGGVDTCVLDGWDLDFHIQESAVVTNALGSYSFRDLSPGTYVVREVTPAGWIETAPADGFYSVAPTNSQNVPGRDFGNRLPDPGLLQFSTATSSVGEAGGSATITVTRSDDGDGLVLVDYATTGGTGTAGKDYTATSGTLSFGPGVTSATFTVPILDDNLFEGDETVELTLSNPTNGAALGSPRTAVLTILGDEVVPVVSTNPTSQAVPLGAVVTFTAAATGNPFPNVQWQVSNNGGVSFTDIQAALSNNLTFQVTLNQSGNLYRAVFSSAVGTAATTTALLIVTTAATTTQIVNSPSLSEYGQNVMMFAGISAVAPSIGLLRGDVQFQIDGAKYGAPFALINGIPQVIAIGLSAGTHSIVAYFTSTLPGFTDSDSSATPFLLTVKPAPLTVTAILPSNSKVFGQTFPTFTGTVTGLKNGDLIGAAFTNAGAPAEASVGSYATTATLTDPDNKRGNYAVTRVLPDLIVTPMNAANLQMALASSTDITLEATTDADAQAILAAVNGLPAPTPPLTVTINVNLGAGPFTDLRAGPRRGVTLLLTGNGQTTIIVGNSPALVVAASSGTVIASGVTFTTNTHSPTILVQGGALQLRHDTIQESSGANRAAITITGGSVDLGSAASPGQNIFNVNGLGEFIHNTGANPVAALGNTFQVNGMILSNDFRIEDRIFDARAVGGGGLVTFADAKQRPSSVYPVQVGHDLFGPHRNPDARTALVRGWYQTILGRAGDRLLTDSQGQRFAEYTYWTHRLQNGDTVSHVLHDFWNAPEHRAKEVLGYYRSFLNRSPDPAGFRFCTRLLTTGTDEPTMIRGFVASPEYRALHAGNRDYVRALYHDVLGRDGKAAGIAYWTKLLNRGAGRDAVAQSFVHSTESYRNAIDTLYTAYFQRAAEASERAYWLGRLEHHGLSFADLAIDLLASGEFHAKASANVR
jgi:subtilisin-like proprotein convertase family protein